MNRYFVKRVAAAAIVGIFVFLSTRSALSAPPDLLPDLVTSLPGDFWIEVVNARMSNEKKWLHLRNEVPNIGAGALEMYVEKDDTGNCDGVGSDRDDRLAYQEIFQDETATGCTPVKLIKTQRLSRLVAWSFTKRIITGTSMPLLSMS